MLSKTYIRHLTAIRADAVTRSNVIGLRKLFSANRRRREGYTANTVVTPQEANTLLDLVDECQPVVIGDLDATGKALLRNPRYRKRLAPVADIIAELSHFRLLGFNYLPGARTYVPYYRAVASDGRSFVFRNVPWQSGGDGPELDF